MGIFRKKSHSSQNSNGSNDIKVSKADAQHLKVRTASVHDPILQAVNEAQPFEEAALDLDNSEKGSQQRMSYNQMVQQGAYDVFGKPINNPDISNPLRSRDERPLDTIRGFEYSITGDASYRERLESDQLGFRVRNDFPSFGSNPYGAQQASSNGVNAFQQQAFEQGVYQAPAPATTDNKKKKKRGLFGRKKKD